MNVTETQRPVAAYRKGSSRLGFLDWTRGLAALIMLQGHVFHSFVRPDLRQTDGYVLSQFVGGITPAVFLFLTGVTMAFLLDSKERQTVPTGQRILAGLRRAGYLLALAFAFRLQLWLFAYPQSHWSNLFKVDILNCMAMGLAVASLMAVFTTLERVRLCAILGLAIATAAPLVTQLSRAGAPALLKNYLAPSYDYFSFFPWAAFLMFGVSAGSVLRVTLKEDLQKVMQWSAMFGFGLLLAGQYFSNLPYSLYAKSEFWLDSPWLILMKLGIILLILPFAYVWTSARPASQWSWVQQLGTTSLIVYWVHIELVYGRWLGFWKENLTVAQATPIAVAVILLMIGLSLASTRWRNWARDWGWMRVPGSVPERVAGD